MYLCSLYVELMCDCINFVLLYILLCYYIYIVMRYIPVLNVICWCDCFLFLLTFLLCFSSIRCFAGMESMVKEAALRHPLIGEGLGMFSVRHLT